MRKRIAQIAGNRADGTRRLGTEEKPAKTAEAWQHHAVPGIDCILNCIRRTGSCVIKNIRKELVVKDAVASANHGLSCPKKRLQRCGV